MKKAIQTLSVGLGLVLLTLPAAAGPARSLTRQMEGYSYKLTHPKPLSMGQQTLKLRITKGAQPVSGAVLSAEVQMADGMKAPVQIHGLGQGQYVLKSNFSMGGIWELRLKQTKPTSVQLDFRLDVTGGHAYH